MDARKYLAELVGTFILVVVGSMTIVAAKAMDAPILVVVPFGFGLGLLAAIQTAGYVSGGHFNPAVTLAALIDKRIDVRNARAWLAIGAEHGSVDAYLLAMVPDAGRVLDREIEQGGIPDRTAVSDALSKDLRQRGFTFVGSTIVYAFMQSVGLVDDHVARCFRYRG
jgi:hypothetical protein